MIFSLLFHLVVRTAIAHSWAEQIFVWDGASSTGEAGFPRGNGW